MAAAYNPLPLQSTPAREDLILQHLPQVRWIAASIGEKLGGRVAEEDLISTGIVGLISAVDNYDPSRNSSLRTYAEYRIRGAILDSVRGADGIPPHKRKRLKEIEAAITHAQQRLQRTPSEEDIAAELGIPVAEYQEWLLEVRGVSIGSLDFAGVDEENTSLLQYIAHPGEGALQVLERAELERALAEAIEALPEVEKIIIDLYFRRELTLAEAGRVVNVRTSRASQLKMQAILRLRAHLEDRFGRKKTHQG